MKILPSLLYTDAQQLKARFNECLGVVNEVHIDFADGDFVPNTLPDVATVSGFPGDVVIEAHLMVQHPEMWVEAALNDVRFERIIVHAEAKTNVLQLIQRIQGYGRVAGIAIKPETPVAMIEPLIPAIDEVLVLLVDPGFNGSPFQSDAVRKIRELKERYSELTVAADGGMNPETLAQVAAAGVDRVAVGSYLHDFSIERGMEKLEGLFGTSATMETGE